MQVRTLPSANAAAAPCSSHESAIRAGLCALAPLPTIAKALALQRAGERASGQPIDQSFHLGRTVHDEDLVLRRRSARPNIDA